MHKKNELIGEIEKIIIMHHYFMIAALEEKLFEYDTESSEAKRFITEITRIVRCSDDLLISCVRSFISETIKI